MSRPENRWTRSRGGLGSRWKGIVSAPWACLWLLTACAAGPAAETPQPPVAAPSDVDAEARAGLDGDRRLGELVRPSSYELDLRIDPNQPSFSGRVSIVVVAERPVEFIELHAAEMSIQDVQVALDEPSSSAEAVSARAILGKNGALGLKLSRPVSGQFRIAMQYEAGLEEEPMSLYRVSDRGKWYAFTQFEPLSARAAFPCFDEPQFKTPFRVTIRTPVGMQAVSNAPLVQSIPDEPEGWVRHDFRETRPLPTYLVALAVGELEFFQRKTEGAFPFRIVTTHGRSARADFALHHTKPILKYLTDYFDGPYPYQKLDQIAVPNFRAGAMENAGLVAYRESILLLDQNSSLHHQIRARAIIAHELAHMWFGGLVTMRWWDDIWLNESFATWMASKVLHETWPQIEPELYGVKSMLDVMNHDALPHSAPIRKSIHDSGDIKNAFDFTTYTKGAAVLRMIETWLGQNTFQQGMQLYAESNAWKNASLVELVEALESVSSKPSGPVLSSFVTQAGVPLVRVDMRCDKGKVHFDLTQSRYATIALGTDAPEARWNVPVCIKLFDDKSQRVACELLSQAQQSFQFDAGFCPIAIYPNAEEVGYYHFQLDPGQLNSLATKQWSRLSLAEKVALPQHAWALLEAGQLELEPVMALLEVASADSNRVVLKSTIGVLQQLVRVAGTESARKRSGEWVGRLLTRHKARIGLEFVQGEPIANTLLRPTLYTVLGRLAGDEEVASHARAIAARFLREPASVSESDARLWLPLATQFGGKKLHQGLVDVLGTTPSTTLRETVVFALGSFEDPALMAKSFELFFERKLHMQDHSTLVAATAASEALRQNYWKYYLRSEQRLIDYLGTHTSQWLPSAAAGLCSTKDRAFAAKHFADTSRFGSGAEKTVRQSLETIDRCAALRSAYAAELELALNQRGL